MDFNEVKNAVKAINFESLRKEEDGYFEAVIFKKDLEGLNTILKSSLGEPAFPSNKKLSKEIENAIDEFGGIMRGQTLYYAIIASSTTIAMLWPWQDGQRITLKLFLK